MAKPIPAEVQHKANQALDSWFASLSIREQQAAGILLMTIQKIPAEHPLATIMYKQLADLFPTFPNEFLKSLVKGEEADGRIQNRESSSSEGSSSSKS